MIRGYVVCQHTIKQEYKVISFCRIQQTFRCKKVATKYILSHIFCCLFMACGSSAPTSVGSAFSSYFFLASSMRLYHASRSALRS